MTPGEAVELIFEAFKSHWEAAYPDAASRPALSYDGIPFDPKSLTEPDLGFVRISVNHVDGDIAALGDRLFRRTGSVIVQCFGPSGKGIKSPHKLASNALKMFERPPDALSAFRFISPGVIRIGDDGQGWYQVHATTTMQYDTVSD